MFGSKDKERLVGASEKLAHAKMLKAGMSLDEIKSKREGGKKDSTAASVVLIYFIACAAAYFLTAGWWKSGAGISTGHEKLDWWLFSAGTPAYTGNPELDYAILIALRGLFLFLCTGILPFASFVWMRLLDRSSMSPYRTVWGVTLGLGVVYLILADLVIPAIKLMLN